MTDKTMRMFPPSPHMKKNFALDDLWKQQKKSKVVKLVLLNQMEFNFTLNLFNSHFQMADIPQ